jgi:hypothetical protein
MKYVLKKILRKLTADDSGHFAVTTAIVALPLMLGVSVAIDSNRMGQDRTKLKSALDGAALAAVTNQTLSPPERAEYAKKRFWDNVSIENDVNFGVVKSGSDEVELLGEVKIPTLMSGVVGKEFVKVREVSAAVLTKGATVCMLALDEYSGRSFEVTEGATLDADCSVQVNSKHEAAAVVDLGGKAAAQSFCVAGGATGEYQPYVNTECAPAGNPYEVITFPEPESCISEADLEAKLADWRAERDAIENHEIEENERTAQANREGRVWYPTYFEKLHLQPGNYCNGLFLEGKEFILDPGAYHITSGSVVFGLGTELVGEGVTFVLHNDAKLEIRDGSILDIKGPSEGPLKGLVIAQNADEKALSKLNLPNVTSTITDGAILNILGTIYLPTHKIEFLGGSLAETRAPATSFIAHQISIRDGADIGVSADHAAADIPPLEPRTDDSARLIR